MRDKKQCDIEALERNNPRISALRMRGISSAAYRVGKVKSARVKVKSWLRIHH